MSLENEYKQRLSKEEGRLKKGEQNLSEEGTNSQKDKVNIANDEANYGNHEQNFKQFYEEKSLDADFFEQPLSNKPTLEYLAEHHLPISISWDPTQIILPGTLFHSSLYKTKDPWSKESCFIQSGEREGNEEERTARRDRFKTIYLPIVDGTSGSYKSTETKGSIVKQNHESYGFTAKVELGFCTASASLVYDRDIKKNNDDYKVSSRSSYRSGSVIVRQTPSLKPEAARILKYDEGLERFEKKYGDYYVSGYNIGADNTIMVSTDSSLVTELEKKIITANAKSFLFDVNYEKSFDTFSTAGLAHLRSTGYDTLKNTNIDEKVDWADSDSSHFIQVQIKTRELKSLAYNIATRVEGAVKEQGLLIGLESLRQNVKLDKVDNSDPFEQEIDSEVCKKLIKSNLVAELVLMPIRTLRDVQYWAMEDDVI